jgi:hypothetical protein
MRIIFAAVLTAALGIALASTAAVADTAQQGNMKTCAANWKAMPAGDQKKTKYKDYMSGCMKAPNKGPAMNTTMAAPKAAPMMAAPMMTAKPAKTDKSMKMAMPESGSAKCKDGKVVMYKHRSGTCSGHGGVATWM